MFLYVQFIHVDGQTNVCCYFATGWFRIKRVTIYGDAALSRSDRWWWALKNNDLIVNDVSAWVTDTVRIFAFNTFIAVDMLTGNNIKC